MTLPSNSDTKMLFVAQQSNGGVATGAFVTDTLKNATPSWTQVVDLSVNTYRFAAIADDGQSGYFWGTLLDVPKIAYSGNVFDGSGVDDRSGNIVNTGSSGGFSIGICGG
jgi:hypothetical protein